ncbi:MAG: hypothetical protein IJK78_13620 [Bacteroidales bacterium]|nr:hypothetical protein [Bacteroidales bacterium]
MKVKLYIENELWRFDECFIEAEFFSAPHAGDYVSADWDSLIDTIIKANKVKYYVQYLTSEVKLWYLDPKAQKTRKKPTDEQIRDAFMFDGIGLITSVSWDIDDGVAYCRAWVGYIE